MYGKGLLKGLRVTLGHHLEKNITTQYPEQQPDLAPGYRGVLDYDIGRCIACGACTRACPNHVLDYQAVKGADGKRHVKEYVIDLQYCMFCGLCVEACTVDCLYFSPHFELAVFQRPQIKRVFTQEVEEAPVAPANAEADEALIKKQESVKKLAAQMGQLKKEARDESLSPEERAQKQEKAEKLAQTINRLNQEIKQMKAEREGGAVNETV